MRDLIRVEKPVTKTSEFLIFDENAIENSPLPLFNQEQLQTFKRFMLRFLLKKQKK